MRGWAGIYFMLDGAEFGFRAWERVPRIGDTVVFAPADQPYKVVNVFWREQRSPPGEPYAEVMLEK